MSAPAADIAEALFIRCNALAVGSPNLPIAWPEPETAFDPPADGRYLIVQDFTNRPRWEGLTSGRLDQGLLQITVVWPKGQGVLAPKTAADQVLAHFAKGLPMTSGAAQVKVSAEPWQASPMSDDISVSIHITIPWTA